MNGSRGGQPRLPFPVKPDDPAVIEVFKRKRLRLMVSLLASLVLIGAYLPASDKQSKVYAAGWQPWIAIATLIAVVTFVLIVILDWKCPACKGRLGQAFGVEFCDKCGVRLVTGRGVDVKQRNRSEDGSSVGALAFRRGSAQPADRAVIEAVKRIKRRYTVVSGVSVTLLAVNISANGKTHPAMSNAVEQVMKHAVFGALALLMAEFFFDWKCPKCKCRLSNLFGEFCANCGVRLKDE